MGPSEPDRLIEGRYRLGAIIGQGGMGVVWQARDELLGRNVAVKEIIWPVQMDAGERETARRRAVREAQMAARLSHPNVVGLYDIVEEDGRPWIVMELVPFRSLRDAVLQDGPLSPARAARIGLGILAALQAAHRVGVLHRDVKPANILLGPEGRVVLADFGIARAADSPALTTSGVLIGSPSYISPERAHGERAGPAGDLWALGASLYAAVEGRPPFDRDGALASLTAVVTDQPDPPSRAGPLWPVISGLLRKDPGQRLDAAEVERMLLPIADGDADGDEAHAAPRPDADGQAQADGQAHGDGQAQTDTAVLPEEADPPQEAQPREAQPREAQPREAQPREAQPPAAPVTAEQVAAALSEMAGPRPDEPVQGTRSTAEPAPLADPAQAPAQPGSQSDRSTPQPDPAPPAPTSPEPVSQETAPPEPISPEHVPPKPARQEAAPPVPISPEPISPEPGPREAARPEPAPQEHVSPEPISPEHVPQEAARPEPISPEPVPPEPGPPEHVPQEAARPEPGPPDHASAEPGRTGEAAPPPRRRAEAGILRRYRAAFAALAAAVVIAAGVAVGLALASSPGTPHPAAAGHSTPPSPTSPGRTSPPASSSPSATGSGGSGALPAGYYRFTNSTGFSIGVPTGWQISHDGHYVYIRDPANSGIFLLIDQSDQPKSNPLADWEQQAANREGSYPGYRLIRLQSVRYPQAEKAADWEFTYDRDGQPVQVLNRNVLANADHAYALYWSTPEADWAASLHYFQAFAATFRPAGVDQGG